MSTETKESKWVYALTLGGETTPQQRARNRALYQRLRDGFDDPSGFRDNGLSMFVYDVPIERLSLGPAGESFSFRLDKNDECFYRLLHVIADYFDERCDADDERLYPRARRQAGRKRSPMTVAAWRSLASRKWA